MRDIEDPHYGKQFIYRCNPPTIDEVSSLNDQNAVLQIQPQIPNIFIRTLYICPPKFETLEFGIDCDQSDNLVDIRVYLLVNMWQKNDVESGSEPLYPTMVENPELRWSFIRKTYSIISIQLILTIDVAALVVTYDRISTFFVEM